MTPRRHTTLHAALVALLFLDLAGCGGPVADSQSAALIDIGPIIAACRTTAETAILLKAGKVIASLGFPQQTVETLSACQAYRRRYSYGTVYYLTGASDAYAVAGDLAAKYASLGEQASPLGYPVGDETGAPDGVGRFLRFQHGSIEAKPSLGVHAIWGPIYDKWLGKGAEGNAALGYPITDVWHNPASPQDDWVSFENGAIYKVASNPNPEILIGWINGQNATQVQDEIRETFAAKMGSDVSVLLVDPIVVSDYTHEGTGFVHNRRFTVTFHNQYHTPSPTSDAFGTITLTLELYLAEGETREVDFDLVSWSATTSDSGLYSGSVVDSINAKIKQTLDQIVGPQLIKSVPNAVIDVKPMPDGSLNVYSAPLA